MDQAQQLPNAEDLETTVIGAILLEADAIYQVSGILQPEMFYNDTNRKVFQAIMDLYKANEKIDILTVVNAVKKRGWLNDIGGAYTISVMTNRIASAANIEAHAIVIVEKWLARKLIEISNKAFSKAHYHSIDILQLYGEVQKEISDACNKIQAAKIESIGEVKKKIVNQVIHVFENGVIKGQPTPVKSLTSHTGGWQDSTSTIVAARPGMGKTAFALECCLKPALEGIPTAFFSLEMSAEQLVSRALASESNIPVQKIVTNKIERYEIESLDRCKVFDNLPVYVIDKPDINIESFKTISRQLVREKGVRLIVLDYLQLMSGTKKGNREQEIAEISRGIKVLSRELNIPIITLSQLNRTVEARDDKRPILSDLRESGSIEQDADNVLFLFRPEYYGFQTYVLEGREYPSQELIVIIIAKYRNGSLGEIKARWIGEITKITDYDM